MDIKVPVLAESISLARVLQWHVKPGDQVQRGNNMVDIETDKVTLEVPAPAAGVVKEILCAEETDVQSEQVLATLEAADTDNAVQQSEAVAAAEPEPASVETTADADTSSNIKTGPAVRNLLQQHNLNAEDIPASGPDGRLLPEDVHAWLRQQDDTEKKAVPPPAAAATTATTPAPTTAVTTTEHSGTRAQRRESLSPLRQSIAKRLLSAQHESALLTTFNELDMSAVMALRKKHGQTFQETHGVKLGYMSFFIRACIAALRRFPAVGAAIDGNEIVYHEYHDISIAVGSPRGLVVPVIRDADKKSLAELENMISDFGTRAKDGALAMDEMLGGTFTITNGGIFGSLLSTPIVNPPQSAILGMHKIQQRPVVDDNGAIVAKPMMYTALTYDHRIIDGREAVQFLVTVKGHIEDPLCLLLDA